MSNLTDLIIVVADYYDFTHLSSDFIESAFSEQQSLSNIEVIWRKQPEWIPEALQSFGLVHKECLVKGEPYTLHLTTFPSAIRWDVPLQSMKFPFQVAGFILIIDLNSSVVTRSGFFSHIEWLRSREDGGFYWARTSGLPSVVVALHQESPFVPIEGLAQLLNLGDETPVLPYKVKDEEIGTNYLKAVDRVVYTYEFTAEFVNFALTTLIEQIEI